MTQTHRCPQCGGELTADAPEGLCPRCLLMEGVQSTLAADAPHGATPGARAFEPPEVAEIAKHFPQLEILELLGHGGMGVVYKARQPGLDRFVALKILPPDIGADPAFAQRFSREARSLARLNHPNIVAVYDFGLAGGFFYFLMEYVDGVNLRQMERTKRLAPEEALAIVPQICEALQYAHDEGIVHRDIKPENILIDRKGRVKIADFGLAKLLARGPTDYTLTQPQHTLGTIHYMAPEQMERPSEVDHRADIYSLGVVFYEMLTGELPLGRFQPPSEKVQVDVRLDEVVLRTLAREPERRYQRASQVKMDVDSIASGVAVVPPMTAAPPEIRPSETGLEPIREQLRGPANALLAAGVIVAASAIPSILLLDELETEIIKNMGDEGMALFVILLLLTVPVAALVILAAVGMRRLQYYGLALTGCVLAMVPLTPGWLVAMPLALWALLALRKPDVRAAFARKRAAVDMPGPGPGIRREQRQPYLGAVAFAEPADRGRQLPPALPSPGVSGPGQVDIEAARHQVQGPATGLFAVGVLNCVPAVLAILAIPFFVVYRSREGAPFPPPEVRPTETPIRRGARLALARGGTVLGPFQAESGRMASVSVPVGGALAQVQVRRRVTSGIGLFPILLVVVLPLYVSITVFVFLGSRKMKRLESYGMAVMGSIAAMLPCAPGFMVGLPIGIWSLVVLSKPEVKAAFELKASG